MQTLSIPTNSLLVEDCGWFVYKSCNHSTQFLRFKLYKPAILLCTTYLILCRILPQYVQA